MYQSFKYILTLFFLQLTLSVVAQNYTLSSRNIDNENGLLGSRVSSLYEDKDGFIWMATLRGIGRYDGHQFKWLTKNNSDLREISSRQYIVEDDDGYLWVIGDVWIDLINYKTLEIISLEKKIGEPLPFKGRIKNIKQGKDLSIYFMVEKSKKWYKYHSTTGFVELPFLQGDIYYLGIEKDKIWACHYSGKIEEFNIQTGEKRFSSKRNLLLFVPNYEKGRSLFWKVHKKNLVIYEAKKKELKKIYQIDRVNNLDNIGTFLLYLPERDVFVTNLNGKEKGLTVINLNKNEHYYIENSFESPIIRLRGGWVTSNDVIWMREKRGVQLYQINPTSFRQYPPYISCRGIGIMNNHLYAQREKVLLDKPTEAQNVEILGAQFSVEPNIKDELWIGGDGAIFNIDTSTRKIKHKILHHTGSPNFWSILRTKEGQWWGGTQKEGLVTSRSPANDSLYYYEQYNGYDELKNKLIVHLLEDGKYIWAATPLGLYLIDKKKGILHKYSSEEDTRFQLPVDNVQFIYKDKSNNYWLATSPDGLLRFQLNEQLEVVDYKRYTIQDGLSSNVLYSIIEDDKERLWISTLNGISCFDKKTERIQTFYKEDGITELEYNRNSFVKGDDGRIYFGGLRGVTGFHPDEVVKSETYAAPIYLTQFLSYRQKSKQLLDQTQQVNATQRIVLQPTDRFFRLSVAMIDYFNSNKLGYSYKIEGLLNEYQNIEGNTIEIGGLPYGHYTLKVRGQSADKRFSSQELTFALIVVRPFYLRWWFILVSIIVIAASILQIYFWRVRHLDERKNELEMLVHERTAQIRKDKTIIEEQAFQLKELDELKSKFFANISHELRTPLSLILGPLDTVLNRNRLENKDFTYLQIMRQNGNKLLKRINELLDLSRLDANRLEVIEQPTFLYPFIKTLISTFESAANIKNIQLRLEFQLDENIQVLLDDDKIEKIITNYLSNALKFTPKEGSIILKISRQSEKIQFCVSDTGIGILPNDLIKIFDRFYQADSKDVTAQRLNGAGIGLSLCRELAKVLNGKVWATSEIGKGSIFFLELPLVETFAIKENVEEEAVIPIILQKISTSTTQKFRPNLLIVEDNPDLRQFLTMILQEDYNIVAVENGRDALEQLLIINYQLIISDIMMPVMDGIQLLTKVKKTEALRHIPMIMLTARQSLDVKIETLRIGVDDYLTKPFKEVELKARVANLIENSQNRFVPSTEELSNQPIKKPISAANLEWLKELETILEENISNSSFKVADAASQMAISLRRLQQKLKEVTGLTPKQYQRSIRLNKARTILKSGKVQTVSEAMYQIGIENRYRFSKMYQQEFGVKPSEELR